MKWMLQASADILELWTCAGMVGALTNESATSKAVYFAHCTSEMIYITHLLAEQPERLAGPLLADTYVTLLKGRNAWYGEKLAKGELKIEMGDNISGKGMIQVSNSSPTVCQCKQSPFWPSHVDYCYQQHKLCAVVFNYEIWCMSSGLLWAQGVSAVEAFHELLRQPSLSVMHPELNKPVAPVELCPILRALYKILIQR